MNKMDRNGKIYVAGHNGMVGSAIVGNLKSKGYGNIVTRSHSELDLTDQKAVEKFFAGEKPDYVVLAAAKVGGIMANNTRRADFIYENIMIESNVIHSAYKYGVKKLLFLGSTCIYPKNAPQPMKEGELLTSPLEYTNEPYAIAKIAGIKMCESYNIQYGTDFIAVMPTNLYGENDNFDLEGGHVLPAMLRKMHLAKLYAENDFDAISADFSRYPVEKFGCGCMDDSIEDMLFRAGITKRGDTVTLKLWGTGKPLREFMYSGDMADASVFVMENISWNDLSRGKTEKRNCHINIGTEEEISISDLAKLTARIVGFDGVIKFDDEKPDGMMRKLTDCRLLHSMGWKHSVSLEEGVRKMYEWYKNNLK